MNDQSKTKAQLIRELNQVRDRTSQLEDQLKAQSFPGKHPQPRYQDIVALAPDGILMLDLKGFITHCNAAWADITGLPPDQILGRHFTKVVTLRAKDVRRYLKLFSALISGKGSGPIEFNWVHADGTNKIGKAHASVVRENGKIRGLHVIARDITERKLAEEALRESEQGYRAATQTAHDAIIVADIKGIIISWNQGASNIFGYNDEEILGQPLTKLMPKRYEDLHSLGFERATAGGQHNIIGRTVEFFGLRKDGEEFPLELSVSFWETKQGIFYTGIIRDITKRKLAEEVLHISKSHLEVVASIGNMANLYVPH